MAQRKDFERALRFVKRKHRGQFRAGSVPVWHHVARVSHILDAVLGHTKEGIPKERFVIILAALGHDLLEDTDATEDEIHTVFGNRGLQLIMGMTNTWGDKTPGPYVRKVTRAEEAVRLIKLSDLYDNISNVTYNLHVLGLHWTMSYFLPIVSPMRRAIVKTTFSHYGKSATRLMVLVDAAATLLEKEMRHFRIP